MPDQSNNASVAAFSPDLAHEIADHVREEVGRTKGAKAAYPSGRRPPPRPIWARITGNQRDGSNFRWFYSWEEVYKSGAGYGGNWAPVADGWSGSASNTNTRAYNRMEDVNTSTGKTGSGASIENLPAGFELQPVPDGTIVMIDVISPPDDSVEYWFSAANGVDGSCT